MAAMGESILIQKVIRIREYLGPEDTERIFIHGHAYADANTSPVLAGRDLAGIDR